MIVLVTGHEGFLGRHFKTVLERDGHAVQGCDPRSLSAPGDARDLFRRESRRYDLIIHCAAYVGGRAAIEDGSVAQAVNLELDAAMFRYAVRTQARRVLYISSSAVYPVWMQNGAARSLTEDDVDLDDPQLPDELYGWTKLTGEMLAARARADVPVTVVRPFSGYGTDQDVSYPFAAFMARVRRRDDPFVIWGTGEQVRDWVHVDDVITAALTICDAGEEGPVNIGTGVGTSMKDLVDLACSIAGYCPELDIQAQMPAGVNYRVADTSLMSEYHMPAVSLEEGIRRALQ